MSIANRTTIAVSIMMVLLFSMIPYGCDTNEQKSSIYDSNAKILQKGDSFTFMNRVGVTNKNQLKIGYNRFCGVQTIKSFIMIKPEPVSLQVSMSFSC